MQMHNPPHPGDVLRGLYMEPLGLTVTQLAAALGLSRKAVSQLVNGHARITPAVALKLAKAFSTSAEGWMDMQTRRDLWLASRCIGKLRVPVLHASGRKAAHG